MAEYNIRDIRQRHLRRPPVSQRRLETTSLDLDVPIEHSETEQLPLRSHETLGVGYGFDRLYYIDLSEEQPVPKPLPSRHELAKLARDKSPHRLAYGGHEMIYGSVGERADKTAKPADFDNFFDDGALGIGNSAGVHHCIQHSVFLPNDLQNLAEAFIGSGSAGNVKFGYGSNSTGGVHNIPTYDDLCDPLGNKDARDALQVWYNTLSPSAWETLLTNRDIYAEIPKLLPYLDKAFFGLYERNRLSSFKTRVRDPQAMITVLSMIEAMYTIRRGRFSRNCSVMTGETDLQTLEGSPVTNGVVNHYFKMLESKAGKKIVIAPWWLCHKLNNVLYLDTDRDEEIKDVERKDLTEMMTLLLESMEVERGLAFSTEQNLDLLVFDKYADGEMRDFTDFKSDKSALAATMLGFASARDVYYRRPEQGIGRLPYYHKLLASNGTFIGKEKNEFLDRVQEQATHTMLTASPEHFKNGMQYANAFDYSTMVTRTRFGDHSMEMVIHPFGFTRGLLNANDTTHIQFGDNPTSGKHLLNLAWFPVYSWSQLCETTSTEGLLPKKMNGMYYGTGLKGAGSIEAQESHANSDDHIRLWSANYYRPGLDNYCARLLKSLDEMFLPWIDRGEQVRSEGAVFPNITTMNLMAEKLFTTPMAMLQRNFPFLRKLGSISSTSAAISNVAKGYDFMSFGDNVFKMSVHHSTGKKGPLALRERNLFATQAGLAAHARDGDLNLAPIVLPLTKAPENWVSVFQTRDALNFLTSLNSEPIMDAYTTSDLAGGISNGMGSARLVVYQGPKNFEGFVEDVFCTPLLGLGKMLDSSGDRAGTDYTALGLLTSTYPTGTDKKNDYIMFLLDASNIEAGTVLRSRLTLPSGVSTVETPSGTNLPGRQATYSEDCFIPGLYWDKLWLSPWPQDGSGNDLSWAQAFSHPDTDVADPANPGIGYLRTVVNSNSFGLGTSEDLDTWKLHHARWIEGIRTNLEYQRAAPSFYIFDLDITDLTESRLRTSLFPLGKSTIGPLTFVGSMGHDGNQELSETITGETCFEIIDLTTGAGDLSESPSDADDMSAGEENPSMHIATQQDV